MTDRWSALGARVGTWRVQATILETADADPFIEEGLRATRRMCGPYLEESMGAAPGSGKPDFVRPVYLRHFAEQRRWQYVSLDGRFPIGVLPAWSDGDEADGVLRMRYVEPGFDGLGELIERRIVGTEIVLTLDGPDHDMAEQYWKDVADPVATPWVGVRYDYWRED